MEYSLFNVNNLTNILEVNKIESTTSNCYLFLMFFLQRSQLVSNIIKIYNDSIKNTLSYGIKYCILNQNYERIFKKMKEFRADNDKGDLINEIFKFIKNSMDDKSSSSSDELSLVKYHGKKTESSKKNKIDSVFQKSATIIEILNDLDNSFLYDENDVYEYFMDESVEKKSKKIKIENEIKKIDMNWDKFNEKEDNELYKLLNHWFTL